VSIDVRNLCDSASSGCFTPIIDPGLQTEYPPSLTLTLSDPERRALEAWLSFGTD
jgi:hypothetical protein